MKEYSAFGTYKVTTEADCEGRRVKDLGIHTGYLEQIAFALADECYYSLCFKQIDPEIYHKDSTATKVSVSLDVDSGTWILPRDKRVKYFKNNLVSSKCTVTEGQYHASVILSRELPIATKKKEIMSKLSSADVEFIKKYL